MACGHSHHERLQTHEIHNIHYQTARESRHFFSTYFAVDSCDTQSSAARLLANLTTSGTATTAAKKMLPFQIRLYYSIPATQRLLTYQVACDKASAACGAPRKDGPRIPRGQGERTGTNLNSQSWINMGTSNPLVLAVGVIVAIREKKETSCPWHGLATPEPRNVLIDDSSQRLA